VAFFPFADRVAASLGTISSPASFWTCLRPLRAREKFHQPRRPSCSPLLAALPSHLIGAPPTRLPALPQECVAHGVSNTSRDRCRFASLNQARPSERMRWRWTFCHASEPCHTIEAGTAVELGDRHDRRFSQHRRDINLKEETREGKETGRALTLGIALVPYFERLCAVPLTTEVSGCHGMMCIGHRANPWTRPPPDQHHGVAACRLWRCRE